MPGKSARAWNNLSRLLTVIGSPARAFNVLGPSSERDSEGGMSCPWSVT